MAKRKYTHIKIIEPKLIAMRAAGKTNREIAEFFGLEIRQIENWVNRIIGSRLALQRGLPLKRRGRPRKHPAPTSIQEYQYEIDRLKMENELLRDFLQLTERLTIKSQPKCVER